VYVIDWRSPGFAAANGKGGTMDSSFGDALARSLVWQMIGICLTSAALGIGGFLLVRWVIHHIAIIWR